MTNIIKVYDVNINEFFCLVIKEEIVQKCEYHEVSFLEESTVPQFILIQIPLS